MTPALKAMVEAMAAEFGLQARLDPRQSATVAHYKEAKFNPSETGYGIKGDFNLEKVARAGLAAIREPGQEIADRVCDRCNLDDVIDEILKETP